MATETLVKTAIIEEQVFAKISNMRQSNLTTEQTNQIRHLKNIVRECFTVLNSNYFGLSREQIFEFSDKELEALFGLIYKRAAKTSFYVKIFFYGVPIIGWFSYFVQGSTNPPMSYTFAFTDSTRKLKKMLGDSFNPVTVIQNFQSDPKSL